MKKPLFQRNIFKKLLSPLARGVVKQIPFVGNPVSEVLTNLTLPKDEKKHTVAGIITQVVIAGIVIYALYKGMFTPEEAIDILRK